MNKDIKQNKNLMEKQREQGTAQLKQSFKTN